MSVRIRANQGDTRVLMAAQRANHGFAMAVGSPDELRKALVAQRVAWAQAAQAAASKPASTAMAPSSQSQLPATLPVTPREIQQQQAACTIAASLSLAAEQAAAKLNEVPVLAPSFEEKSACREPAV